MNKEGVLSAKLGDFLQNQTGRLLPKYEPDTEKLEELWAAHLAHCWQCADFSTRACLLGRTLEDAVLQRWIKDFRKNPELFVKEKEGVLETYRQQVAKYLQARFQQRLKDTMPMPQ